MDPLSLSLRFLFNPFLFPPDLNKKLSLPLQRASSHISLTLHDKREETLLDQVLVGITFLPESRI